MLKIISVLITVGVIWGLTKLNHYVFRKIKNVKEGLQFRFFERFLDALIIIYGFVIAISSFGGFESVWKSMLGGTAILSAILGFAGQDAIKDVIGGLMITLKAKKGKKGIKEIHALVERKTYYPISLRVKVAFIWTTVKISNFHSGGITDEMLRFPKEQFSNYKFVDKR